MSPHAKAQETHILFETNATFSQIRSPLRRLAGLPTTRWAFALRIWLACLLALYASFWLQLEAPSSAVITVAILAFPTGGQAMDKALFRILATMIGLAASIAIAGLFTQTDALLLVILSAWVGLCVYVLGVLDGNRTYAAALSCYTVALVLVQQLDTPQNVFAVAVARGSAIAVGIFSVWLINGALAAPDYYPIVLAQLEKLSARTRKFSLSIASGEVIPHTAAAALYRDIANLRPEVAILAAECCAGIQRGSAARAAMVKLATQIYLLRSLAKLSSSVYSSFAGSGRLIQLARNTISIEIARLELDIERDIDALRAGRYPVQQFRAPLYKSRRIAAENGARAACYFAFSATFFVMTGWPTTDLSLSLATVVIGLGYTTPSLRKFSILAAVVAPIACLSAGLLKYVILDGVSDFPLLAIGLAPFVVGLSLLIASSNPTHSALGRFSLIFTLAIVMPANLQSYDPNAFLITCFMFCLATLSVCVAQLLISPLSEKRRLAILLREHPDRRDVILASRDHFFAPEEATYRNATWLAQVVDACGAGHAEELNQSLRLFDEYTSDRRCDFQLTRLEHSQPELPVREARAALKTGHVDSILAAGQKLLEIGEIQRVCTKSACATLVLSAVASQSAKLEKGI